MTTQDDETEVLRQISERCDVYRSADLWDVKFPGPLARTENAVRALLRKGLIVTSCPDDWIKAGGAILRMPRPRAQLTRKSPG